MAITTTIIQKFVIIGMLKYLKVIIVFIIWISNSYMDLQEIS